MGKSQQKLPPIHPGKILKEEFLTPCQISQAQLARGINVSLKRVNEICQGKRGITPDTAYRLGLYFNLGVGGTEFWMNLQKDYEKECWEDYLDNKGEEIKNQIRPFNKENLLT